MEISEYKNIFENEDTHFLYKSRHSLVLSLFQKYLTLKPSKLRILDAGCGTGGLLEKLGRFGRTWGIDISQEAIKFSEKRKLKVKKSSVTNIPFNRDYFDVVISVDVIYHTKVKNDQKAINEFYRVLKPGGTLIIRVPAIKWLTLVHDKHVHTRNRYDKKELEKKLVSSGFIIQKISFVDSLLLPAAFLKNIFEMLNHPKRINSGVTPLPNFVNTVLTKLLLLEVNLINIINLPIGIGLVAVCRKPMRQNIHE